jgi:hypothetical protein
MLYDTWVILSTLCPIFSLLFCCAFDVQLRGCGLLQWDSSEALLLLLS